MKVGRFNHRLSAMRARQMDRRWFALRPHSVLRLRHSLKFEWPSWGASGHEHSPFVIVFRDPTTGTLRKRTFYAHAEPDRDVATLAAIWDFVEAAVPEREGGDMIQLNHVQHMQLAANAAVLRMTLDDIRSVGV